MAISLLGPANHFQKYEFSQDAVLSAYGRMELASGFMLAHDSQHPSVFDAIGANSMNVCAARDV